MAAPVVIIDWVISKDRYRNTDLSRDNRVRRYAAVSLSDLSRRFKDLKPIVAAIKAHGQILTPIGQEIVLSD